MPHSMFLVGEVDCDLESSDDDWRSMMSGKCRVPLRTELLLDIKPVIYRKYGAMEYKDLFKDDSDRLP